MMIHFWENTFGLKHHFPSYLEGQTQHTLRYHTLQLYKFQGMMPHCNGTSFKALHDLKLYFFSDKTHFGLKHHFPSYLEGQTQHTLKFSGMLITMAQVSKLVSWSVSDKTHFGLKHHFRSYLEGQTQHTLKFSGVPIAMVQVSKLYDDPFLRKHILG